MITQYIIVNLGMSENFGTVDFDHLTFPTAMRIDYVRVYQPAGSKNIGCDPPNFPTSAYINEYVIVIWFLPDSDALAGTLTRTQIPILPPGKMTTSNLSRRTS